MHIEGNYKQGEKTAFRMGENNSKLSNWQRINLKNIRATPAAQFQKNKRPNQKMGQSGFMLIYDNQYNIVKLKKKEKEKLPPKKKGQRTK